MLRAILDNSRVRTEASWVLAHKAAEFVVMFASIKLYTWLMPQEVYGEFNVGLTTLMLLANVTVVPVAQAYYRHYHTGHNDGSARSALDQTLRIVAWLTISVAVLSVLLTYPLGRLFGLESLTLLGVGAIFLGNRWRMFWIELLNVKRERRVAMIQNVGFCVVQTVVVAAAVGAMDWSKRSASVALLMYALAAAAFGALGLRGLLQDRATAPHEREVAMRPVILSFGGPLGILLVCQWLQTFADRYVLASQLGLEVTGKYVGVYQVCGVPFMFLYSLLIAFVVPIAYQRATSISDARQVWRADKVLVAGVGVYLGLGALAVLAYFVAGQLFVRVLTTADYVVSPWTTLCLAAARYLGCLALLLHTFFKVHHRTVTLLIFSAIGGVLIVPICWILVSALGLPGAALGLLLTALIYNAAMILGPSGCLSLMRRSYLDYRHSLSAEHD